MPKTPKASTTPTTPTTRNKKSSPAKPALPQEAAAAFAEIEPELETVQDVVPINVDIPRAVAVAVGAAPHIHALLPRMVEELPRLRVDRVEKLPTYALAAWYAHLLALPGAAAEQPVSKALLEDATALRKDLLVAAEALSHKGFLDAERVAEIRSGQGHLDTANDLVALAALFSEGWAEIEHKTTVEWSDIERASQLGPQLLVALGAKNQPGSPAPKATDPQVRRAKAFTLLVQAYEECRRGVSFLRWYERDLDSMAPSLFAARAGGGGGKKSGKATSEDTGAEAATDGGE